MDSVQLIQLKSQQQPRQKQRKLIRLRRSRLCCVSVDVAHFSLLVSYYFWGRAYYSIPFRLFFGILTLLCVFRLLHQLLANFPNYVRNESLTPRRVHFFVKQQKVKFVKKFVHLRMNPIELATFESATHFYEQTKTTRSQRMTGFCLFSIS